MLNIVSLECVSFRVIVDTSNDSKEVVGKDRSVQGSLIRKAMSPPTTEEVQEAGTARGVLTRVYPWG